MGDRHPPQSDKPPKPLVQQLMTAVILGRWLVVLMLWLTLGLYSLWGLRQEIPIWLEHLTWASVRYGLGYNPWASFSLVLCIAYTCAVLVWHSQKLLKGWSARETYRFEKEAQKIAQNPRHWLWYFLKLIQQNQTGKP